MSLKIPIEVMNLGNTDRMMRNLKQYVTGRPVTNGYTPGPGYVGEFSVPVRNLIKGLVGDSQQVLNLFSGRSDIGTVRIDFDCPEATWNISVEEFIARDRRDWEFVILDPPYRVIKTDILREYTGRESVAGNTALRAGLTKYLRAHADNVIWLDYCAPIFPEFRRHKLWLLLPRRWETVRVLSWLKRSCRTLL